MEETTSRRARLEQELGLLQQDVASLCSKLQRAPNFAAAEEAPVGLFKRIRRLPGRLMFWRK